jgi:hypothetical protein
LSQEELERASQKPDAQLGWSRRGPVHRLKLILRSIITAPTLIDAVACRACTLKISPQQKRQDLTRIWATGRFADVSLLGKNMWVATSVAPFQNRGFGIDF